MSAPGCCKVANAEQGDIFQIEIQGRDQGLIGVNLKTHEGRDCDTCTSERQMGSKSDVGKVVRYVGM